jgi:hypothetical protein
VADWPHRGNPRVKCPVTNYWFLDHSPSPTAVKCSAVQCSAVQCSAVQCSAVQCSLHRVDSYLGASNIIHVLSNTGVGPSSSQCTALHCTALHWVGHPPHTALHCTALHCTALHCTGWAILPTLHCTRLPQSRNLLPRKLMILQNISPHFSKTHCS